MADVGQIKARFHAYLLTEKRVSLNTFDAYKRDLDQFDKYLANQNKALNTAQEIDVKKFLLVLRKAKCNARSIARKISTLKAFYLWAKQIIPIDNPLLHIQSPKLEKKLPVFLQENEIEQLFAAAQQVGGKQAERNKLMLYLLYASGMRISELLSIRSTDVHLDTGFIAIKGKGGKGRLVPIPDEILQVLKSYVHPKSNYLFCSKYGQKDKPMSRQLAWMILKKICKRANITKPISPHCLRHSLATHLLKKGAHLRALQLLLGHESITTVQIYTHVEKSHLREMYDKKHPRA